VAGILEKKHWWIIQGLNRLNQLRDGPLHWVTGVAECLETFENWLPLEYFDNSQWIQRQWVELCLKQCASDVLKSRQKGMQGKQRLATVSGETVGNKVAGNLPQLGNTTSWL
jgi:hypothetical protein